jgi:hypothetical protein
VVRGNEIAGFLDVLKCPQQVLRGDDSGRVRAKRHCRLCVREMTCAGSLGSKVNIATAGPDKARLDSDSEISIGPAAVCAEGDGMAAAIVGAIDQDVAGAYIIAHLAEGDLLRPGCEHHFDFYCHGAEGSSLLLEPIVSQTRLQPQTCLRPFTSPTVCVTSRDNHNVCGAIVAVPWSVGLCA